jgi:methyl-accepting chemotaxis protein
MGVALELYVNGEYAGARGRLPPDYDLRATHYAALLLPASATESGRQVTLALRCAYNGSVAPLPVYAVGDAAARDFDLNVANFWNGRLYEVLAALCAFLGIYFLAQFIFKTSEKENLFFALTLLLLAVYLFELGGEVWPFKAPWIRALARSSLLTSMMFILPFYMTFFGYLRSKKLLYVGIVIDTIFIVLFLVFSGDETALLGVFNLSCVVLFFPILVSAYMGLRAAKDGATEAWPVLTAIVLGIALAGYDSYYSMIGSSPFVWLQGIAFFALNLSIFIALSMRQARLKSDLERYAREVETKTEELAASLAKLEDAGSSVAALARELDQAASSASLTAEASSERSRRIGEKTERQASEARRADELVSDFVVSIERINENLAAQTESLSRTASAATELSSGADTVAENIERTASFVGALAELTGSGEKSAAALAAAMERISSSSAGIAEVVEAVEDFAERTNLLAMNAAIEAAHAGVYGRGFAIISGEVKKLAFLQSERASRIKEIVTVISANVGEGANDTEKVRGALKKIASGAKTAAERIAEVTTGTREQKRASEEISSSMESLAAAASSIRDEASRQAEYADRVRSAVASIASESVTVLQSTKAIVEDGASLAGAIRTLGDLAAKSRAMTANLAAGAGTEVSASLVQRA